ncbi:MAG: kinase 1 [Candidatus Methanomethylophilaceae archaeon]|nr:kinase 1 [Candidatus Methanomethylophilaceae archaeon]MDI3541520.1 kinase 1 [Candidatus Methanomethylophilaceae archaeon]
MAQDDAYTLLERKVDAIRGSCKTGDERKVIDEVFDRQTLLTIYGMMIDGLIDSVEYPISTGKEGNVFLVRDKKGRDLAMKIFRTSNATFKRIAKYIEGDPRFRGISGNRRKVIYAWTSKEYRNLQRYTEAGLRVPRALAHDKNCLLMEFIGEGGVPAPKLKDADFDAQEVYATVVSFLKEGYCKARLIHGDLSEYNILYQKKEAVIIDCGQAVTVEHYNAVEILERDVVNINRFFRNRGVKVIDHKELLNSIMEEEG